MEDFENATVRAITALKCLGITNYIELYQVEIPPVGTVLRPGFMVIDSLKLSKKVREELVELQDQAVKRVEKESAQYIGQMMLDNPENYGLV
jgi:hypothetical protein